MDIDTRNAPKTQEILLDGLRQALQARVAQVWTNVTLAGEPNPRKRFKEGIMKSVEFYEEAWKAIKGME